MKPRLLVATSTYPRWRGDSEPAFVHQLSRRLVEYFEVTVVCPSAQGAERNEVMDQVQIRRFRYAPCRLQTLVNDGGIVANLRRSPWKWLLLPGFLLAQYFALWREIQRTRPHVAHAHWLIPQGLMLALLSLCTHRIPPFIVTCHGADLYALSGQPWIWLKRFVGRRAALLAVVSRSMRAELQAQGIKCNEVAVEPMGVDLRQRFTPSSQIARSKNELLFVGRLVEKKGLKYLIEALPKVLESFPHVSLTIAGFGPEESSLRNMVQRFRLQDRVHFIGAVPQEALPDVYRRAALFVAPFVEAASGDQEGLGLVTIEAMGCGCPVVVSDLPAVADVVTDALARVPPADPDCLALAIVRNLQLSEIESLGKAKRQREAVLRKFDWPARAKAYANLLRSASRNSGLES